MRTGQLVFEFLVAAVLFFAIVIYILTALGSAVVTASEQSQFDVRNANAIAIGELLMKQRGSFPKAPPLAMGTDYLGLAAASGYPTLDPNLISDLDDLCGTANPADLYDFLNLHDKPFGNYHYNITLSIEGETLPRLKCGEQPLETVQGTAHRLGRLPTGELVILDIAVW
ncbi:MAG: hypothetical protein KKA90_04695 [Nanoarchaeota archaeon]|nr:hypothetical protein [Nanoarchaeota archaeon]